MINICELVYKIYNYFYYSILKNRNDEYSERLMDTTIKNTLTLSEYIEKIEEKNKKNNLYKIMEEV
jgi:hypothetical protein